MRARVDAQRCVGHGRCYELAPQVFGEDERGHCRILAEDVPPVWQEQARVGEANCPERAISIEEA